MVTVYDVQFEHYLEPNTLGLDEREPRISWKLDVADGEFEQSSYEVEVARRHPGQTEWVPENVIRVDSPSSKLVAWPCEASLTSREQVRVRISVHDGQRGRAPSWSQPIDLETGLLERSDWVCHRIAAPWKPKLDGPDPEQLFRRAFRLTSDGIAQARLYITAQGVYEAEINGNKVGDYFLAPGWTTYNHRLQYQTYDVTAMLVKGDNCIGARVAEGWFSGRIGFDGGHRNIWGTRTALYAQLEITYTDGRVEKIASDASWTVKNGPIERAEIYDGERYDARLETPLWSNATIEEDGERHWEAVELLDPLPESTQLVTGFAEPVRRVETLRPIEKIITPTGKTILDFGQNIVGYLRIKHVKGPRGHKITLSHAEVLEHGELCTRPLRICKATDEYVLRGDEAGESYEPRFTFHGFRYAQIDDWPRQPGQDLGLDSIEAVVCRTDMPSVGHFECSDALLNKLYDNVCRSIRGNFLSVPTDCPQRDERLGWTGDIAIFAPTAVLLYDCHNILVNWLIDVEHDQRVLGGVPPMVSPNATLPDPKWCRRVPCAIWHDATILVPWALYEETGDARVLARQYDSMSTWMKVLPRGKEYLSHLWDPAPFQLGDWLDPAAPPDAPWKTATDARMIANMFLVQSLELMGKISGILGKLTEQESYEREAGAARAEFHAEYVTPNGLLLSDSQAAYALAIHLNLLANDQQQKRAAERLVRLARKASFAIGTGFAGTPYVCEALARTGNAQVAYAMLLETRCPSWLYPVTMGATTTWERWDSMLPDGSVNPGEMTSFNHYALGAVAKFLLERIAGLQRLEPGWTRCRVAPAIGADFTSASASHKTPYGTVSCSWQTRHIQDKTHSFRVSVHVPFQTEMEVVLPSGRGEEEVKIVPPGQWSFESVFERDYEWPVTPLPPKS